MTVNPGLLTPVEAVAGSGSGGTYGDAFAGVVGAPGVVGPVGEAAGTSVGPTTSVGQGTFTFIGAFGGAAEAVGGSTSSSSTTAGGSVYQYNLANGVHAFAAGGWQSGTTSGGGAACAIELGIVGACIGSETTVDPAGDANTYTIAGPLYVNINVTWSSSQPVTITSNIPLLPQS